MNKNTSGPFFGAIVLLAAAPHVTAQQAPRCSDLYDDAQRLACYDAAFGKPARSSSAATVAPRTPGATAPTVSSVAPAAPASVRTAPSPPVPAAAPTAPAEDAAVGSAGVSAVTRRADGRLVVTLDNGQVWSQLERDNATEVAVGDKVNVRRGSLGSYILTTRSGVQTKVKLGR